MASREEVRVFRSARAGQASAQVALGRRYLFGGIGLQKNPITALYWLDRAACQDEPEAWILIGCHVPFETARQAAQPSALYPWYERAFDAGVLQAGVVLAKLVLAVGDRQVDESVRRKAWGALEMAAAAGMAEAQWLLAQRIEATGTDAPHCASTAQDARQPHLAWATRAAENGVLLAQRMLANHAWDIADAATFLRWSLPVARAITEHPSTTHLVTSQLCEEDAVLLCRCAQALFLGTDFDANEVERFWEFAARAGNKDAQLRLGLWFAKMDENGKYLARIPRSINYRKALHWLALAGEQGLTEAWYVMSRIFLKPEFSRRSVAEAEAYMELAASGGHLGAQVELGKRAWKRRHRDPSSDVRAAYWLQKASNQGCADARSALSAIAEVATPALWIQPDQQQMLPAASSPFLAARIELAVRFGLTQPEALLLDLHTADRGHCLLVDIRGHYARSRRRLILIQTDEERGTLTRVARLFENVDCGPNGPEGNYRQRCYRLKTAFSKAQLTSRAPDMAAFEYVQSRTF